MSSDDADEPARKKRRAPDPSLLREDALRAYAVAYLDQRDATVKQLRSVLLRRAQKNLGDEDLEMVVSRIDAILLGFQGSRLLDDRRFAGSFVDGARRRGASARKIAQKLGARGLQAELIGQSLRERGEATGVGELEAALTYAQKRRFASKVTDPKQRERALAALARQGFSFEIARRALEMALRDAASEDGPAVGDELTD